MKAVQYIRSLPRYALMRWIGPRMPSLYTSVFSPVKLRNIPEPKLPTQSWVRIAPILTGICGSDIATFTAKGSPYLAPITSMPFVLGHELVGRVIEVGQDADSINEGERVVIQPALGCEVRSINPACNACANGQFALCANVTRGNISAGIQTGYCRDTGGGLGENLVAHKSQVYRVPNEISDRAAVLIEPFACAVHGVLRANVKDSDRILIIGCGSIGLLTIAALRALGSKATIIAVAKHEHQREHAESLGADRVIPATRETKARYTAWAKELGADVLPPELGKPTVIGGADITFDCIAGSQTIDDAIRFTRSGGTLMLVGMPSIPKNVDWTPLWFKELTLKSAYAYGVEHAMAGGGKNPTPHDTFYLAIELMRTWHDKLTPLTSTPFSLADYRSAIRASLRTGQSRSVKTVIAVEGHIP